MTEQSGEGRKTAVIIGAGPAGLTAALEFCRKSSIRPIVLESGGRIGGLACTVRHNGNRIDVGGHRFFSKSDRVMDWWTEILPLADEAADGAHIHYQNQQRPVSKAKSGVAGMGGMGDADGAMLVRPRKSRILFEGSLFEYPLSLSGATLRRLGFWRGARIVASYLKAQAVPRGREESLEDFLVHRFGRELYRTFFKSYTEKVWGVPCERIPAAWGAQRIKGVSLRKAVLRYCEKRLGRRRRGGELREKNGETSLIEQFLYPKYGPGQLWERVAGLVEAGGGEVRLGWRVTRIHVETGPNGTERIGAVEARTPQGKPETIPAEYFLSTMPVRELLGAMDAAIPEEIQTVAEGLKYRDFLTVGLLADRLLIAEEDGSPVRDTWIYLQEPAVRAGRMQIFNNWSPHMVADPAKMWIGLEYFCDESDALWRKADAEVAAFAIAEAEAAGILKADEVRDSCVIRAPKAYPAYFGSYARFEEIVRYMERFENLFLVGRNGMHRYNNQDHSMLTAMMAVENILGGVKSKQNLWSVNAETEYHEETAESDAELRHR